MIGSESKLLLNIPVSILRFNKMHAVNWWKESGNPFQWNWYLKGAEGKFCSFYIQKQWITWIDLHKNYKFSCKWHKHCSLHIVILLSGILFACNYFLLWFVFSPTVTRYSTCTTFRVELNCRIFFRKKAFLFQFKNFKDAWKSYSRKYCHPLLHVMINGNWLP